MPLDWFLAHIEAKTYGEQQTPVHYAAKNDAVDSLKVLLKMGCDLESRDSKWRTPLQVAAELGKYNFIHLNKVDTM